MAIKFLNNVSLEDNELQNFRIHRVASDLTPRQGGMLYNTTLDVPKWSDGTAWYSFGDATSLATPQNFSIAGKATAAQVSFDGTGPVVLTVTALDVDVPEINLTTNYLITGDGAGNGSAIPRSDITLNEWGVPTANINWGGYRITNLADPVDPQDAATKKYVDDVASGLDVKAPVRLATTGALPAYTASGSPDGDILTANANGAFPTTDGETMTAGQSILVKDEAGASQKYNGIYELTQVGTASVPWILTRRDDADESSEVSSGMFVFVEEGTANANTGWVLTTDDPITLGTSLMVFSQFSGSAINFDAGNGMVKVGNTFHFAQSSSYTTNAIPFATGAATIGFISPGSSYQPLRLNGSGVPEFGPLELNRTGTAVANQLQVVNGGTGLSSITDGGIMLGSGTANVTVTARPTAGQILVGQSSGDPDLVSMSGDATMTELGVVTIGTDKVTNAKLRNSAGLSVIGRSANTTGDPADITAGSDHQVLRRSGATIGFGAVNLAQSAAVTGILQPGNGGTGSAYFKVGTNLTAERTITFANQNHSVPRIMAATIGDGVSTVWTLDHSWGTTDVLVQCFGNAGGGGELVRPDINASSSAHVTLTFAEAPETDQYRVVLIGSPTTLAPAPLSVVGS